MNADIFTVITANKPAAIGIGVAALVLLYLAFKAVRFVIKMLLFLAALAVIGFAVWWFFGGHHGAH